MMITQDNIKEKEIIKKKRAKNTREILNSCWISKENQKMKCYFFIFNYLLGLKHLSRAIDRINNHNNISRKAMRQTLKKQIIQKSEKYLLRLNHLFINSYKKNLTKKYTDEEIDTFRKENDITIRKSSGNMPQPILAWTDFDFPKDVLEII